jgi:thiamine-monophosphate kinase
VKERELIERIRTMTGGGSRDLLMGIGDDCAVLRRDHAAAWLVTMDTLVESVHFDRGFHPPLQLGRKAVSVNVSDIAAMGGKPAFVLLSLGLPSTLEDRWSLELCRGIADGCRKYGCLLIGGDTVRTTGGVSLTLAVIGEMAAKAVLYRSGGKEGDDVWVSGPLGRAAAGLELLRSGVAADEPAFRSLTAAHLDPAARTELGPRLAESGLVHAMMDLSDGLATDLSHLCRASGLGAEINAELLPGNRELAAAADHLQRDPLEWMIAGGEDYELLFTAPRAAADRLQELATSMGTRLYRIGTLVPGQGVRLLEHASGVLRDITYGGYDHFR